MLKYGRYYFYMFIEQFIYMAYIAELRIKDKVIMNHHIYVKSTKIMNKYLNVLYKHTILSKDKPFISLEPVFSYGGQFFAKFSQFQTLMKQNNLEGSFLFSNNIKGQTGKNFFLTKYKNNVTIYDFLKNEEYKNLFLLKQKIDNTDLYQNLFVDKLHFDFNFLLVVEIYKILILIKITKIIKKYI